MSIPLIGGAVAAIYPIVADLVELLAPVGGATTAIVLCTAALRLLLVPLTMSAVRGERVRQEMAPQLKVIQERYGKDPQRLQQEMMAFYQKQGTSPLAGCLPMLAQSPFFMIWYQIFVTKQFNGQPNLLLSQHFFGASLSEHLLSATHPLAFAPWLLTVLAMSVLSIWRMRKVAAACGNPPPRGILAALPLTSLLTSLVMPLAATVYMATTMSWTAAENAILRRGMPPRKAVTQAA